MSLIKRSTFLHCLLFLSSFAQKIPYDWKWRQENFDVSETRAGDILVVVLPAYIGSRAWNNTIIAPQFY